MSLFDPFFVNCIVFDKDTTHYSTSKFHDIHGIQGRFWWFYICRLYYVEYSGRGGCYDQSIFYKVFTILFLVKTSHLLYSFLKHMTSFWWLVLLFIDEFFTFSLRNVIYEKYTNTNGKHSKDTNTIDIILLYCRLYWRLLCRLYWRLFCRLYWILFFGMQYFLFSLLHKCSKFMALSDTSRMLSFCYYFFSLPLPLLFNAKSTRKFVSYI